MHTGRWRGGGKTGPETATRSGAAPSTACDRDGGTKKTTKAKRRSVQSRAMLQTSVEGVSLDPALTGGVALLLSVAFVVAWTMAFYR
ncbi:hypothetical protein JCM30237_08400 [Halolamina litorea]